VYKKGEFATCLFMELSIVTLDMHDPVASAVMSLTNDVDVSLSLGC